MLKFNHIVLHTTNTKRSFKNCSYVLFVVVDVVDQRTGLDIFTLTTVAFPARAEGKSK